MCSRWWLTFGLGWAGVACAGEPQPAETVAVSLEAQKEEAPKPEAPVPSYEIRKATRELTVYRKAASGGAQRGVIAKGRTFRVVNRAEGKGCGGDGWAEVEGAGYVCLEKTEVADVEPVPLPQLVPFVHPDPVEWTQYSTTGEYNKNPGDGIRSLVPFIYGKRWRKWKAPHYSSVEAYEKGAASVGGLESGRKYSFVSAQETSKGTVLVRENGAVVPADQVFLYPISKFHGRELATSPVGEGLQVAWVYNYDGTPLRKEPNKKGEVEKVIPYHTALEVRPVEGSSTWLEVPNGIGPGVSGYVDGVLGVRHWSDLTPPADIQSEQVWIDIDLDQQMLALMRGSQPQYITMISGGKDDTGTPRGIYRIQDKKIWGDMASREGALPEDVYYVEKVPWILHIQGRYALHGAFWHWGFGNTASHGCVNLAPLDAQYLFGKVGPTLSDGWSAVYQNADDVGTTVRIRRGQQVPPEKRGKL